MIKWEKETHTLYPENTKLNEKKAENKDCPPTLLVPGLLVTFVRQDAIDCFVWPGTKL